MSDNQLERFETISLATKLDAELILKIDRHRFLEYPEAFVQLWPGLFELTIDNFGFPKLRVQEHPDVLMLHDYLTGTIVVIKLREAPPEYDIQ